MRRSARSHRIPGAGWGLAVLLIVPCVGLVCQTIVFPAPADPVVAALLAPAPRLPVGHYDLFGSLKDPLVAADLVRNAGLDTADENSFRRLGLVKISPETIEKGRDLFFRQFLGDVFAVGGILNFAGAFNRPVEQILTESFDPLKDPDGVLAFLRDIVVTSAFRLKFPTTNLRVQLSRDLRVGSQVFPAGATIDTGADVEFGALAPVGFEAGTISCSLCHAAINPQSGLLVPGLPNNDLNIRLFIALSTNTAAAFLRLNHADFDPLDPKFPRGNTTIIDSTGNPVTLPDPVAFERAIDDFIMQSVPFGGFEAAPDGVTAVTKIPDNFVFGEGGMGWDGGFQIGPFGGIAAFSNAVHTLELNLLSPFAFSQRVANVDPEVYLGTILQNAAAPDLRLPSGVKPSQWLAQTHPGAERGMIVDLPGAPDPSLFSLNGLVLSPPGEPFMDKINALAAFQASLVSPPNKSAENLAALQSGAVARGAEVFNRAGCATCHAPPFYTNGQIVGNDVLKVSAARGKNRGALTGLLVEAQLFSFDEMVPLRAGANLLTLPPAPGQPNNLVLPAGLDGPDGGYKVTGLLGTFLKAPYLHDGSVSVATGALSAHPDGTFEIIDPDAIDVFGTTRLGRSVSAEHSLRALLDRDLRNIVIANNRSHPEVVQASIDGAGHDFFIDPDAGFSFQEQADAITFLLALDDNPGQF